MNETQAKNRMSKNPKTKKEEAQRNAKGVEHQRLVMPLFWGG